MSPAPEDEGTTEEEQPDVEAADGTVLAPEELDFTREREVAELEEGRFVIGTEGEPNVEQAGSERAGGSEASTQTRSDTGTADETTDPRSARSDQGPGTRSGTDAEDEPRQNVRRREESESSSLTGSEVKRWLSRELARTDSQYAYRIAAKTEENISHQQLASDDVNMAFDGLLMWYAQHVGGDTAVEEALGILLSRSNIRVRYPVAGFIAYLERHGLGPDDDISELLRTIREEGGFVFPPGHHR